MNVQIQRCENDCGNKGSYKAEYEAFLCNRCKDKLEAKVSRAAITQLRKNWRNRT